MHHGVTYNFGSKCVHLYLRHLSLISKDIWIAATVYYMNFLHNCAFFIDSYSSINKCFSFVIFSCYLAIEFSCFNTLSLHTFSFS